MADIKNIAGRAKDILVGNNIRQARQGVLDAEQAAKNTLRANRPNTKRLKKMLARANEKANADDIAFAQKQLKNIRNYNVRAMDNYSKAKKNLAKERLKTYGTRAGVGALAVTPGAVGYGVYRHNKNNKEKSACDIVVDSFEKIAELTPQQQRALNGLQGIRNDIEAKKTLVGGISRTEKDRVLENAKKKREAMMEIMKNAPDDGKITLGEKVKALLANKNVRRGAIGATALGAGAIGYGVYKHNKKKKEKTAYDVVVDAFEKIAIEEEKPISTVGGTVKGSLVGGVLGTLAGGLAGAKAGAELIGGKGGAVKGALAGAAYGAATGGTFGGSIGHAVSKARARDQQNRYLSEIIAQSKKNKEKTAYDIVVDAFEKIAEEEY